jgi:class 3 adenylate cyclase
VTAATRAARAAEGTVVFTDLIGFTEFTATRGDEDALALLYRLGQLVDLVLPADARKVKDMGDGLLLWFTDACTAVETMLRLQDECDDTSDTEWPLWVRVGAHSGRALLRGDDLVGHDVNVAARIVDVAGPGEVLVSEGTVTRVRDGLPTVEFEEIGPVTMKGLPEPVRLFHAQWAESDAASEQSPGRRGCAAAPPGGPSARPS